MSLHTRFSSNSFTCSTQIRICRLHSLIKLCHIDILNSHFSFALKETSEKNQVERQLFNYPSLVKVSEKEKDKHNTSRI